MTQRAAPHWLTQWEYAHRGLHSTVVPENSRSAAEGAIAAGLGIECDIQLSRDSVPLVFHDWELERLTKGIGKVGDKLAAELSAMALNDGHDTIWTLSDLLSLIEGRVPLLVEIKSLPHFDIARACAAVAQALQPYNGSVAVMSFDPRMGEWFAKNAPDITRGLVATDTLDHGFIGAWRKPHALERAQPDFLACDIRDIPNAFSSLWRDAGRPLLTWTVRTADLRSDAQSCADALIAEGDGLS